MKRLFCILSCCLMTSVAIAQEINNNSWRYQTAMLDSCLNAKDYKMADVYANALMNVDSLTFENVNNIAKTFYANAKYNECLNFITKWEKHFPEKQADFEEIKSYILVAQGKWTDAENMINHYHKLTSEKNIQKDEYTFYLLAVAQKNNYKYKEAGDNYFTFLNLSAKKDNTTIEKLSEGQYKEFYGNAFYSYAYNFLFQGNEIMGDHYLSLAEKDGNQWAKNDRVFLKSNPSFANPTKLKRKYIMDYNSLREKFKVYDDAPKNDVDAFWNFIEKKSPEMVVLNKQLEKKKPQKTLRKAMLVINNGADDIQRNLKALNYADAGSIENAIRVNLVKNGSEIRNLKIYQEPVPNAFATPYGEIYLTDGLVYRMHGDYNLLTAVCAHEMTHYVNNHSLIGLWESYKKQKNNEFWGALAAGLAVGAMAYADGYNQGSNQGYNSNNYYDNYNKSVLYANLASDIMQIFDMASFNFKFKYDRKQEIESDYIAYRFCEANGIGGYAYITALQLLGDERKSLKAEKNSDHPTINYRVQFLKYVYDKEHGIASVNNDPNEED